MTKNSRKLPMTDEQIRESDLLKGLYTKKKLELGLTQDQIAADLGEGVSQGAVSHFMNRRTALNLKAASVFAKHLKVSVEEFSPRLARELKSLTDIEPEIDLGDSYSFIPQYSARAAAGAGHDNPHVEIRSTLAFKKEWLAAKGLQPRNLRVIYADGESMWPTISHQDVLLVDSSQVEPIDNGVFVIESGTDGTVVKRLVRAPLQQWILRSDNTDKAAHPDRFYLSSESNEHQIVGRVIWRGGDL